MEISKEEIALYLIAYTNTLINSIREKNLQFTEVFYKTYIDGLIPIEFTRQNYEDMITIHCYYCNIKILSFFKDCFYKGLDERKIYYHLLANSNELNEKCLENFTKKEIILYIRNALSHNDKENPLYWFERDKNNQIIIHILLKQTKASLGENKGKIVPFEIILDLKTLMEITKEIAFNSKNYHFFGITFGKKSLEAGKKSNSKKPENLIRSYIDGAYYYRNFYKQLSEEELHKIDSLPPNDEYMEKVKEILGPKLLISKTKKLSQIQKNTLYKNILEYTTNKKNINIIINIDLEELLDYETGKVIPLGIAKIEALFTSMLRALSFTKGYSYNDSMKELLDGLCYGKEENLFYKASYLLKTDLRNYNERARVGIIDDFNEIYISLSLIIGYTLDSIITTDEIVIDNKIYDRLRLRNSFIHGRWYVSDNCWELFDGEKNEFNYDWHKSIDLLKLQNTIINYLFDKSLEQIKKKHKIRKRES